ncbi:MAG: hypothetical protein M1827_006428 [Pycnora praestabilis]|nr:MAG: hypothetical protein M1827_006428 [Pycnora praestabilis]
MGYDISDYKDIDPIYGTLADVEHLIAEMKKRDLKVMIDLVVNHTSEEHAWFLESRKSLKNPKRDWYIWKKPKYDKGGHRQPPNNWAQILGEANSAWNYDEATKEYYLALFTPEQPDLNWENPDVRAAVHDVMHFWLKRGACGFRMDVINLISKNQDFPDGKVIDKDSPFQSGGEHFVNGPRLHEFLKELNREVMSKYDAVTVGEMPGVSDINEVIRVVGSKNGELNMIFIFDIVDIDNVPGSYRMTLHPWTVKDFKTITNKWQRAMIEKDGWNSVFLENHDNPRSVSRYVDDSDEFRDRGAKMLSMMQTTLAGTLYVYQGEELGMRNFPASWNPEVDYKDIESINYWRKCKQLYGHDEKELAEARRVLETKARDHVRTPIQWSSGPNAGFCKPGVTPWMRVNEDYKICNADNQLQTSDTDDLSVWHFWQRGLAARKQHKDVFVYGDFKILDPDHEQVFAYTRTGEQGGTWATVLNFSGKQLEWDLPDTIEVQTWVAGNYTSKKPKKSLSGKVILEPWEALLGKCG